MKTKLFIPGIVILLSFLITPGLSISQGNFFLDENGITVKCPAASPGSTGTVNGTEYEAVNEHILRQHVQDEADLTRLCTSSITDMNGLFDDAVSSNQDIGAWDVSNVTNMSPLRKVGQVIFLKYRQ